MNKYCIYMHVSPSKKVYIGQTLQVKNLNKRWSNGNGYKRQPYFYNAIQKYGWDNFEHIILESNLSLVDVDMHEKYWINFYKSNDTRYGYNLTSGGSECKTLTDIALLNLITSHEKTQGKSVLCLETGVLYTSTRDAMRKNNFKDHTGISYCCNGKQFTAYGYHWCFSDCMLDLEIRLQKIAELENKKNEILLKSNNEKQKPVKCIETDIIYKSIHEASRITGINRSCIKYCLNGKQKTAGKHPTSGKKLHWEYVHLK